MPTLPVRHDTSRIAHRLLLWFALTLIAGIVSPLVHARDLQWVCSGSGGAKLASGFAGDARSGHNLDCPLCGGPQALPLPSHCATAAAPAAPPPPPAGQLAGVDRDSGAPPPARGPPRA